MESYGEGERPEGIWRSDIRGVKVFKWCVYVIRLDPLVD